VKVVVCDNGLRRLTGHNLNLAAGLSRTLAERGIAHETLVHRDADRAIDDEVQVRRTFRHEPHDVGSLNGRAFRLLDLCVLGRRFAEDLSGAQLRGDTVLLLPNAQPAELYGVARYLEAGSEALAVAANVMEDDLRPRGSRGADPGWLLAYRFGVGRLDRALGARFVLSAGAEGVADRIGDATGRHVLVMPVPKDYASLSVRIDGPAVTPTIGCLGNPRAEKGAELLPEIVRRCRQAEPTARFVVQAPGYRQPRLAAAFDELAAAPDVTLLAGPLPRRAYYEALRELDLVLLPYRPRFGMRTSGIFSEAVAIGTPSVVTPATWMAAQIASGHAAGVVARDHDAASVSDAVLAALASLGSLQAEAVRIAPAWRTRTGVNAFLDRLFEELERVGVALAGPMR
jgi:glycosyltransferase involved in cell wall biosynthesis